MKHLIQHLIGNNFDEIVLKSFLNCHAKGLHSIMLLDSPEKTIRLFVTDPDHELYKNNKADYHIHQMSVAFHAHHCNITIDVVKGCIANWIVSEGKGGILADQFKYRSAITDEETNFELIEKKCPLRTDEYTFLNEGESAPMKANVLHTVYVPKGQVAAWLVYEGKEDKEYESLAYSNHDLTKQDFSNLYQRASTQEVLQLLNAAFGLKFTLGGHIVTKFEILPAPMMRGSFQEPHNYKAEVMDGHPKQKAVQTIYYDRLGRCNNPLRSDLYINVSDFVKEGQLCQ